MKNALILIATLATLTACPGVTEAGPGNPTTDSGPEAGVMKGVVTDAQGKPLSGVKVFAGHTLYHNTNGIGVTDANGRYRIEVRQPAGSWYPSAQLERSFNGRNYTFDLHPDNAAPFNGSDGAVRNFTWKLSGTRPDGGRYGSMVIAYADFMQPDLLLEHVELTLEPVGALVDGTAGRTITAKLTATADGDAVQDVPVGRYRITARYTPPGEAPLILGVRLRNVGEYQSTLTADFDSLTPTIRQIVIQVSRP